jgi:NAD(P)-dependent dehydrogenase (short-subunit alcohol dehydrogenase family)
MTTRNPNIPVFDVNHESNQSLTSHGRPVAGDRPTHGAVHPVPGTIEAPIVVIGATGTIGSAVVRALVAAGQPVVAAAPQQERLDELRSSLAPGAVTPVVAQVATEADAAELAHGLRELGRPIAGVVVTFPHGRSAEVGADRGRLLDRSTDALADCLQQTVLAQHALARQLIPLLADSGRTAHYVIVGGPGSETPWAGYGHRSVAMAATRMLARVLHAEAQSSGVRVQLLSIDAPVRGERPGEHECPEWPSAKGIAERLVRLLDRRVTDEAPDAVIACARGTASRWKAHAAATFGDVPSFLRSLTNTPKKITPQ